MAASNIPATLPKLWPPAPTSPWSAPCWPAPTRRRAKCFCGKAAPTRPIAGWARWARWRAAPPTVISSRTSRTRSSWCRRASRVRCPTRARSQTSCISSRAACARRWDMSARETLPSSARKRSSCASPARACAKATSTTSPSPAKARIIPAEYSPEGLNSPPQGLLNAVLFEPGIAKSHSDPCPRLSRGTQRFIATSFGKEVGHYGRLVGRQDCRAFRSGSEESAGQCGAEVRRRSQCAMQGRDGKARCRKASQGIEAAYRVERIRARHVRAACHDRQTDGREVRSVRGDREGKLGGRERLQGAQAARRQGLCKVGRHAARRFGCGRPLYFISARQGYRLAERLFAERSADRSPRVSRDRAAGLARWRQAGRRDPPYRDGG